MNKYDLVIFDLDGVLINSKKNMRAAWDVVRQKYAIEKTFKEYSKFVGYTFFDIFRKLSIKKNFAQIQKEYNKSSIKYINKIYLYKDVNKVLKFFIKKKIKLAIVTSKNKDRTLKLVKKFKLPIKNIVCPSKSTRGKPHPDQINIALKRANVKKHRTIYVGDMKVDYLLAKKSKFKFIFANYGYGKIENFYKFNKINSFKDLKNFI